MGNASWHHCCYSRTCHKRDTERAKLWYENAVEKQDSSLFERRKGHPSSRYTISSTFCSSMEATDLTTRLTCSMANPFNELCFFCQEDKQNLGMFHAVCTFNAGEKLNLSQERHREGKIVVHNMEAHLGFEPGTSCYS